MQAVMSPWFAWVNAIANRCQKVGLRELMEIVALQDLPRVLQQESQPLTHTAYIVDHASMKPYSEDLRLRIVNTVQEEECPNLELLTFSESASRPSNAM